MLEELYDNFYKFNRSEVLHFRKLDQQRKISKENKVSRPIKYTKSRDSSPSFKNAHKQINNINSDGCGPPENWEKKFRPSQLENRKKTFNAGRDYQNPRGGYTSQGRGRG
jgi:hypothetical protein